MRMGQAQALVKAQCRLAARLYLQHHGLQCRSLHLADCMLLLGLMRWFAVAAAAAVVDDDAEPHFKC
jgi:hypothetical protein